MGYEISLGAFIVGFVILVIGIVLVRYYQWVADNFGAGISDYDHYKLYAFIICAFGFIIMLNIHSVILNWLASQFLRR